MLELSKQNFIVILVVSQYFKYLYRACITSADAATNILKMHLYLATFYYCSLGFNVRIQLMYN